MQWHAEFVCVSAWCSKLGRNALISTIWGYGFQASTSWSLSPPRAFFQPCTFHLRRFVQVSCTWARSLHHVSVLRLRWPDMLAFISVPVCLLTGQALSLAAPTRPWSGQWSRATGMLELERRRHQGLPSSPGLTPGLSQLAVASPAGTPQDRPPSDRRELH